MKMERPQQHGNGAIPPNPKTGQPEIPFKYAEREKIANTYHVFNNEDLVEKDGKWFYKGKPIEEYNEVNDLYTGNDNSEIYKQDRTRNFLH